MRHKILSSGGQRVCNSVQKVKRNFSLYLLPPQGDEMKKIGMQPIPMMDRDKKDEVPQGQVRPALFTHVSPTVADSLPQIPMVQNGYKREASGRFITNPHCKKFGHCVNTKQKAMICKSVST